MSKTGKGSVMFEDLLKHLPASDRRIYEKFKIEERGAHSGRIRTLTPEKENRGSQRLVWGAPRMKRDNCFNSGGIDLPKEENDPLNVGVSPIYKKVKRYKPWSLQ